MDILALIFSHWFLFLLFAILILGMTGLIGSGLGLQNIFHDDPELITRYGAEHADHIARESPALQGQIAIIGFLALAWGFSFTLGGDKTADPLDISSMGTPVAVLIVIGALVSLAAGVFRFTDAVGELQPGEWQRCLIGAGIGLVVALAILGAGFALLELFPDDMRHAPTYALTIPALVFVSMNFGFRKLLPVVSLVRLLSVLAILYALISTAPDGWQLPLIGAIALLIVLINRLRVRLSGVQAPLKFEIPGIISPNNDSHYKPGNQLDLAAFYGHEDTGLTPLDALHAREMQARQAGGEDTAESGDSPEQAPPRRETRPRAADKVNPLAALQAWHDRVADRQPGKPKLVLIATSGGAYRATFWTALVLDRLRALDDEGILPGFCDNVRLITGASGGMVGGAYFTAFAQADGTRPSGIIETIEADILAVQRDGSSVAPDYPYKYRHPIPRDSLSAVVQQLVQRDLPGLLSLAVQRTDRGRVLEDQWATLDTPFSEWRQGEAEGWRPSIVFSPMLVETGQPLLIGNLDMDLIRDDRHDETVEFFDWFPASRDKFRVKTAVRLNASFPYIAPASALPTIPYRRVVDAGYYDNYGVDLAVAYLAQPLLKQWITENCSGVALIQIRAFPFRKLLQKQPKALKRAFQWLTTPLEGLLVARGSTMTFRNRQGLRRLTAMYQDAAGAGFLTSVNFEVDSQTSMNWYLPGRELQEMEKCLRHRLNTDSESRLREFWCDRAGQASPKAAR